MRKRLNTLPFDFTVPSTRVDVSSGFIRTALFGTFDPVAVGRLSQEAKPRFRPGAVWILDMGDVEPFDTRSRQPLLDLLAAFKTAQGRIAVLLTKNRLAGMALQVGAMHLVVDLKVHYERKPFMEEIERLKVMITP